MTQEEKNKILAEWLGWKPNESRTRWHSPACQRDEENCGGTVPDFYASEASSALLLEKMTAPYLCGWFDESGVRIGWAVSASASDPCIRHADRKTAIAEACLQLIAQEKKL